MEALLSSFLAPDRACLKVCGVISAADASKLIDLQVPALGLNFWPSSKRHLSPTQALTFLPELKGKILRVGVFVNNARELAPPLIEAKALDVVQLHGDEEEEEAEFFLQQGVPVIRALALPADSTPNSLASLAEHYHNFAKRFSAPFILLLDAHAPGVYGGTGKTINWEQAQEFISLASPLPVLLAGGITSANAGSALSATGAAGLDVASGSEISPGVKDFEKVTALLSACASVD